MDEVGRIFSEAMNLLRDPNFVAVHDKLQSSRDVVIENAVDISIKTWLRVVMEAKYLLPNK